MLYINFKVFMHEMSFLAIIFTFGLPCTIQATNAYCLIGLNIKFDPIRVIYCLICF